VEVLALNQLEIILQSYFLQVVEADQVFWDIHWAVLSHTMTADRILQIEIELEAIWAATLGERLLPELDRIEPISDSQIFSSFCPYSCNHPICIDSCPNEESTRLQAARNILKKCSQLHLRFEQIVHRELATHQVKHNLLLYILECFMSL
jgi:hypothetical protein